MKKVISLIAFFICSCFISAQETIEWPVFKGTTANYVKILKIELSDTSTVINFRVHYAPGMWIRVPKDTYIQNSTGGEKLFVKSAKGINIDEEHFTPKNGVNEYTLYFPPLDKSVEIIDYMEAQWKVFEIEVKPQKHFSIFPDELLGNWFRTDGSNEWCYGFFEDFMICESEIWKQVLINQKDDLYQLLLRKDGKNRNLMIKTSGKNLLIGIDETKFELFSREYTQTPGFTEKNDEEFQLPVFKKDSAYYSGYIKGYVPEMGNTGMIYVNNVLSQEQESYLITIDKDGTFNAGFPMIYPQLVYVRLFGLNENVFFEPGETTFQFFDFSSYHDMGGPKNLLMGKTARINRDLMAMKAIRYFDYNDMKDKILDQSPEEYKAYVIEIANKEKNTVEKFIRNYQVSKKALQIKQMQIGFSTKQNILEYNTYRESAYRTKNNVPSDQREIPLERVVLSEDFYDIIVPEEINNPLSVITGGDYYFFINRLKYSDPVRSRGGITAIRDDYVIKGFESRNIEIYPKVKDLMKQLEKCKSKEEREKVIQTDSAAYKGFLKKHSEVYKEIIKEVATKQREDFQKNAFKQYFSLDSGFALDIINAQDISYKMISEFKPLNNNEISDLKAKIKDEFILSYLLEQSNSLEKEIVKKKEAFNNSTDFVINKTPDSKGKDLFDSIMEKYKGNVVFVDFWATWCGPCRSGMKEIKPLKEELKNEKIKFVYLTNPSSPKETWENLIPDINGEHYYLTQDEWNTIAARFKVSGIPHYVLVDKTGKVVNDKVYFASSSFELKKLFTGYLR